MVWSNFKHYNEAPSAAFESLMNHLFERYVQRSYGTRLKKFRAVNGKGGDGGVESYAELTDGSFVAVQSKWFTDRFGSSQTGQIKNSVQTAMHIRPAITEYIVCMPVDVTSLKVVTAGKDDDGNSLQQITSNSGDQLLDKLEAELKVDYPTLTLRWWFDHDIDTDDDFPTWGHKKPRFQFKLPELETDANTESYLPKKENVENVKME